MGAACVPPEFRVFSAAGIDGILNCMGSANRLAAVIDYRERRQPAARCKANCHEARLICSILPANRTPAAEGGLPIMQRLYPAFDRLPPLSDVRRLRRAQLVECPSSHDRASRRRIWLYFRSRSVRATG
jgi:hypothetical protein